LAFSAEAHLLTLVEDLEEQLKVKVIALQRSSLNSKECELSVQEITERCAASEEELGEARQTIFRMQNQITALEEECQSKTEECAQLAQESAQLAQESAQRAEEFTQQAQESAQLVLQIDRLAACEKRIKELESANRDLEALQVEAEKSIGELDVAVAEKAKSYRELEEKYEDAKKKIESLERKLAEVEGTVAASAREHQELQAQLDDAVRSKEELQAKLIQMAESVRQEIPDTSPEQLLLLREQISSLEKSQSEVSSQLETELSEKESLATRVRYLEDMLESMSQTNMQSSDKARALESELGRAQKDIVSLRAELEIKHKMPPLQSQPSGLHPVYDIFGLPENFETTPTETPTRHRSLEIPISNSPSAEREPKPDDSSVTKATRPSDESPKRQREPSIRLAHADSSAEPPQNKTVQDPQASDADASPSSLLSQKSMRVRSSISELPTDPRILKAHRKKLQGDILVLRKDRQALKKEIIDWNSKFEQDNGREASREEKQSLASDLYDRYQDVGPLSCSLLTLLLFCR
jgi:myosin heavy subunit